ncbi:MAG: penicillin acylase family protein [Polyangiales bacterium]
MRRFVCSLFVLGLSIAGCGNDSGGSGGTGGAPFGDLEWPPDATVYFDEHGVFNADCATDEDCAMALGYYHAFDRFVQMDVRRRFTTGRLADILPPSLAGLLADNFADLRALFSTRDGRPAEEFLYEQATPKTKAMLEAYAAGVNQWIEDMKNGDNGATFPREFTDPALDYSPDRVPAWVPQDSVATVLALADQLSNDDTAQIRGGAAREAIGDDAKFSDLWSREPLEKSAILPNWTPSEPAAQATETRAAPLTLTRSAPRTRSNVAPILRRLDEKLQRTLELRTMLLGPGVTGDEIGSNNWVVGPSLTTAGNALLSNDPHLGMTQPAIWYLANLDAKTNGTGEIHVAGVSFAGLPFPLLGQNERIAWGATTTNMDFSDIYIETLVKDAGGNPTGVLFKGAEVPFVRVPWTVTFSDGSTTEKELLFVPHHGPVREIDLENNTAVTLRWTGNDIDTDINLFPELAAADNIEEARAALTNGTTVTQNWVVIDSENNIGWYPYNRVPKRTWATNLAGDAPPWLPLDGSGDYEWEEYFTLEELPQATNPAAGYIATANNDMTGALFDGDPTTLQSGAVYPPLQDDVAVGFRHKRIVDLIEGIGNQHSRATMDQIISDVHSLIGERMVPGMLTIAKDAQTVPGVNGLKVISALESWDFTCPTGLDGTDSENSPLTTDANELLAASGCAAFHALLIELRARIEANENAPGGRAPSFAMYYSIVDPTKLAAGDVYWDDPGTPGVETKFEVMSAALQVVGDFLNGELGANQTEWAWGRLHGLQLSGDLSAISSVFTDYDNPPPGEPLFANDGGLFTVDVANTGVTDFVQRAGPSMRFVCEASPDGPTCTIQLPGGQSGDIDSANYEDLLFPYLRNQPMPLVLDIAEAAANATRTVTFP